MEKAVAKAERKEEPTTFRSAKTFSLDIRVLQALMKEAKKRKCSLSALCEVYLKQGLGIGQ